VLSDLKSDLEADLRAGLAPDLRADLRADDLRAKAGLEPGCPVRLF
jgi:hypothetical protein